MISLTTKPTLLFFRPDREINHQADLFSEGYRVVVETDPAFVLKRLNLLNDIAW